MGTRLSLMLIAAVFAALFCITALPASAMVLNDIPAASLISNEDVDTEDVGAEDVGAEVRVNYVSVFEMWRARVRAEGFAAVEGALLSQAAQSDDAQAFSDVAYFYFAMALYPEAGAAIRTVVAEKRTADLMLLEGAAAVKMGRWREAVVLLSRRKINEIHEAIAWRGIAQVELGAFNEAAADLLGTAQASVPFEENAADYYLAQAQTALVLGHIDAARAALESIRNHIETKHQRDLRRLLEARMLLARGENSAADNSLTLLVRDAETSVSMRAQLDLVGQSHRTGALSTARALEQLNQSSIRWSGGTVERERLALEAVLRENSGDVFAALGAQRKLLLRFSQSDAARAAEGKIRTALSTILSDEKLPPREAANAFYENIDLAPPGAAGDALIRDAVQILAGLDLLSEAAELLRHQVFERLRGVDRSDVAGDLAELYLAAGNPAAAIETIENTRRTRLPEAVAARRTYLEAEAYFRNGHADRALEVIGDQEDFDALALKGRIFKALGRLSDAGSAYEAAALIGDGDRTAEHSDAAIMAAAVYAQAGDQTALRGLSDKLDKRLAPGPARDFFNLIVADEIPSAPDEFRKRYAAYFDG